MKIAQNPKARPDTREDALYFACLCAVELKRYKQVVLLARKYLTLYHEGLWIDAVRLQLGEALLRLGRPEQARPILLSVRGPRRLRAAFFAHHPRRVPVSWSFTINP